MTRALVFDSGVGGLSVVQAIMAVGLPLEIDYLADSAWLPYGEKADAALVERIPALVTAAVRALQPDIVVLACNTASTLALTETRAAVSAPVVGVVPAIKPAAALSRTGVIGLLATPATVRRAYTDQLIAEHAGSCAVVRAGASDLVALAEQVLAGAAPDTDRIDAALRLLTGQPGGGAIDVIVLACTHFPLLRQCLEARAPHISFIDSGAAVARRVCSVLALQPACGSTRLRLAFSTGALPKDVLLGMGFQECRAIADERPFRGFNDTIV
jgi:glutamate racemase